MKKKKRKPRCKRAKRLVAAHLIEPIEANVDKFMEEFRQSGNITAASEVCGFRRTCVYDWQAIYPDLGEELAEARIEAVERLEEEVRRRATKGVKRPVFHNGQKCGYVTNYSDNLLMFSLKGNAPEKYRDNLSVSGKQDIKLDFNVAAIAKEILKGLDDDDDIAEAIIDKA